jgi:sugar phosphate isomerase/epimerase
VLTYVGTIGTLKPNDFLFEGGCHMKAGWIGFPRENEDFWSSVEAYAKIGYRGMEGGEILLAEGNAEENISRFRGLGLEVLTVSTFVEEIKKDVEPVIERAKRLDSKRATIWAGSAMGWCHNRAPSKSDFYAEVQSMEKAASLLAKEGIKLCYHNHDAEFRLCYDQVRAIDHMMQNSENIWLELDVAGANYGEANPVDVLAQYANRLGAVHIKDYIAQDTVYDLRLAKP